ncbi:uncharacterized protein SCHCODRAFT_02494560 [Schizophyllum commune H4-8]|uniref:CxC2-like cysteine cluster KDZ transposase-associated domain-containing protein n=1 Tax=Schizophyllum commune (strain H4-8 / FGSC 9210) TaxID=578458 RepID=D8Q0U5_SCHCM|nr:uncharacterized protein SCHCODRAFT_02494560 [Schizophyllum commune H4-8]KAI5895151.1 hypothetical protein SCHCODRAFT_02494560 [Schizophyllum commune H4-8]
MPTPAQKSTSTTPSPMPPPPPPPSAPPAGAGSYKSSDSSARISYQTLKVKKQAKRKRQLMAKGDRQNKKNWAEGYTEELAKGGKAAAEYAVKVCHELNYKVPYYLADDQEPDTIPEYDHENPPPLPKLSDEEEKKRAAALVIRNKRVVNWLNYRARKVVPVVPKGSRDFHNAFVLWMMRLTGMSGAPKKARQGWQQYQHENSEFVQDSAQRAWDAKRAKKAGGGGGGEGADGSEGGRVISDGKKKKGVGFTSEHARELFKELPADERRALKERAQAEKEAEKALWEKAINAPPSRDPKDVQAARNALPSFLNPILDGINQNVGDAHVLVLVGGREPKKGGIVTVQHYDVGTNKQDLHFSEWDNRRFHRDVLGLFGEYLTTVWDDDECAKMALEGPLGGEGTDEEQDEEPEEDPLGHAHYRFDSGEDGENGENGENGGNGEEEGGNEEEETGGGDGGDGEEGGRVEVGGGGDEERVEDDVEQPPSKRQRIGDVVSQEGGRGVPAATSIAVGTGEQSAQAPSAKPPRPRPRPTRASTRKGGAAVQPTGQSPATTVASAGVSLVAGIPIDPELLAPPYTQTIHPGVESSTPPTTSPPHPTTNMSTLARTRASRTAASATSAHAPSEDLAVVFPDVPDEAAAWFASAMGVLRVELGGEWVRLLQAWASPLDGVLDEYDEHRTMGEGLACEETEEVVECTTGKRKHYNSRWNGQYWDKSITLTDLGLVYQLGHGGHPCPAPSPRTSLTSMTLISPTGISRIAISYCGCSRSSNTTRVQQLLREGWYPATTQEPNTCATFEALDHFELLAVVANVNVRDYISTLERAGDALHLGKMPDVYKAFGRMSRQWGFLLRMKRAGRAHDKAGIGGTIEGGAAVRCWACPRDGVNMPPGWRDADTQSKFIHTLFLSNDANFRLKNRLRHNARPDGPLGPGFGCIVEPTKYLDHVKRSASEADKNTKLTTGCRVSGAGATSCTRHECIRPAGFGDLQKGERYANMDYIFWSALTNERVDNVMVTYDIGCQWKVNLLRRLDDMPDHLRGTGSRLAIDVRLPVWHGNVHELSCRTANSVRYAKGAGKPDGEGPERIWAGMNSIAYATKEMGAGVREDTIERFTGHHNMQKNAAFGPTLERRHMIACEQALQRKQELADLERDLKPATLNSWRNMYTAYEANSSSANPFMPQVAAPPSEQAVKAQLVQEEADSARHGKAPMRATSKTTFIVAALQLEDQQRRIAALTKDTTTAAIERQRSVQEARLAWFKKLARFRHLQELYMPGAVLKIRAEEDARPADATPPNAEDIKLWLPSDLTHQEREEGCVDDLARIEVRLRVAQATDALRKIREQMYAKHYLINERNAGVVGQRDSTRARQIIERVDGHIAHHRDKYRRARASLHRLESPDIYPDFKELRDGDLTMDDDREADGASTNRLAVAGSRGAKVIATSRKTDTDNTRHGREIAAVRRADGRRSLTSWIWTCLGGPVQDEEAQVHDGEHTFLK